METRIVKSELDQKYPLPEKKKSSLNFLSKENLTLGEMIFKADFLIYAIVVKDIMLIKEIIESHPDTAYLNFIVSQKSVSNVPERLSITGTANKTIISSFAMPSKLPRTILSLAIVYGLKDTVECLVANGADVNLIDPKNGCSPLEYAVTYAKPLPHLAFLTNHSAPEYREIVKVLLLNGATITKDIYDKDTKHLIDAVINEIRELKISRETYKSRVDINQIYNTYDTIKQSKSTIANKLT